MSGDVVASGDSSSNSDIGIGVCVCASVPPSARPLSVCLSEARSCASVCLCVRACFAHVCVCACLPALVRVCACPAEPVWCPRVCVCRPASPSASLPASGAAYSRRFLSLGIRSSAASSCGFCSAKIKVQDEEEEIQMRNSIATPKWKLIYGTKSNK